jgi:hypothetical protein
MVLKIVRNLRRNPSLSSEDFQDRLRSNAAQSARALKGAGAVRYVQCHPTVPDLNAKLREGRRLAAPVDAVEEICVPEGVIDAVLNELAHDSTASAYADIIDFGHSSAFVGRDSLMFDLGRAESPTGAANRLLFGVVPLKALTEQQFHNYWLYQHGPLATSVLLSYFRARRYIQTHRLDWAADWRLERFGTGQTHYGLATAWWSSFDDISEVVSSARGQQGSAILIEDEDNFIDSDTMWGIFAREHIVFD